MNEVLAKGFETVGIYPGDTVFMHSSMKSLGITSKPQEFLDECQEYLGPSGTLLLPAQSWATVDDNNPFFSYHDTPSCNGLLPETFRHMSGVIRSMHPTHSACARGRLAKEMTCDHIKDNTPVGPNSPLRKLVGIGGKILMLGCGLAPNTFMHGVEEVGQAPYLFFETPWEYTMEDENRRQFKVSHWRHGMDRFGEQCYRRVATLMPEGKLIHGKIYNADSWCFDAAALLEVGVAKIKEDPWYFLELKK